MDPMEATSNVTMYMFIYTHITFNLVIMYGVTIMNMDCV